MSWALASFVGLGLALAAGFAWYERTRPSARLISVVGTLAALAIIGRIAFAPIPNVKPTTDIILIAGYALGGAPGFAVGAVAALGSNLFFGEGPWTPWQMGAWGIVGILGAGLARVTAGRMSRIPLALACGVAGLLYGAILDLSTWVTGSGAHSWHEYWAISGVSLPFNVAHAVGNVVFFLAFGPALIKAVQRSRLRFDIAWQPVLLVALAAAAVVPRSAEAATPASRATAYLEKARNADNGWGSAPGQSSNGLHTAWADYALAAAGRPQDSADVLVARLGASQDIGDIERTILALRSCGADPRHAGDRDLVAELLARRRPDGSFGGYTSFTSYAILALRASGESGPIAAAARWVERQQDRDGGFNLYRRGGASDSDDTGYALEALAAAGRGRTATTRRAVAFLRRSQRRDGGWSLTAGADSNAQSTAFAVLGLRAAGADPARVAKHGGRTGLAYLRALQAADGSVRYSKTSTQTPVWVTSQALLAFLQKPLPAVAAPAARASASPGFGWLAAAVAALLAL